jgi:hypothetical protein
VRRVLVAALAAWAAPSMAMDKCAPPNIPRVVVDRPELNLPSLALPLQFQLICPQAGDCGWLPVVPQPIGPKRSVLCLTPGQNAEAEERWRE